MADQFKQIFLAIESTRSEVAGIAKIFFATIEKVGNTFPFILHHFKRIYIAFGLQRYFSELPIGIFFMRRFIWLLNLVYTSKSRLFSVAWSASSSVQW